MMANCSLPAAADAASMENGRLAGGDPQTPMPHRERRQPGLPRRKQRGSEMMEFTLILLPLLGFLFILLTSLGRSTHRLSYSTR